MTKSKKILTETFKIDNFRSSQEEIIENVMNGKNCLILMPTGMGKSLCYQLPALLLDGLTVVISPLIALMKDQTDNLKKLGIDAAYLNSSLSKSEREKCINDIINNKYKILFVSPERFRNESFLEAIQKVDVSLLAIDEAHCSSQWGNDFRPDYSRLKEFREIVKNPVTVALTATATKIVQDDIIDKLGFSSDEILVFNEGINRPNLNLSVIDVIDYNEKYETILKLIEKHEGSKIIYFSLIKSLEAFSQFLNEKKISHSFYHGKMSAEKRKAIQKNFMNHRSPLMLATNAFGMGIDKADIRLIIHAEIPDSPEAYYQEIGRAGRDQKPSFAYLLYDEADLAVQLDFLNWRNPDVKFIKTAYNVMKNMGESLQSYTYEDLQEKVVYKNRGDHRLQTVLNLFDRYSVSTGKIEMGTLKIESELPDEIMSNNYYEAKLKSGQQRLYEMLQYVKTDNCRKKQIHQYFDISANDCDNCDNCLSK